MNLLKALLITLFLTTGLYSQEAGDIDWKEWKAVIPLSNEVGKSSVLEGKELKKSKFTEQQRGYIKKNSNNTYSFTTGFTGVTEEGGAKLRSAKYSSSELVEVYKDKSGNTAWSTNKGQHILKTRIKVQSNEGIMNTIFLARVVKNNNEDIARLVWRDGLLYALLMKPDNLGRRYSKVKIGKIDGHMFDLKVSVVNGSYYMSIKSKKGGLNKPSIFLGRLPESYDAVFRLGNFFRKNDNYDDKATVQIKYANIEHKK